MDFYHCSCVLFVPTSHSFRENSKNYFSALITSVVSLNCIISSCNWLQMSHCHHGCTLRSNLYCPGPSDVLANLRTCQYFSVSKKYLRNMWDNLHFSPSSLNTHDYTSQHSLLQGVINLLHISSWSILLRQLLFQGGLHSYSLFSSPVGGTLILARKKGGWFSICCREKSVKS